MCPVLAGRGRRTEMKVQFTAQERQISKAAAIVRERGITDGQLAWATSRLDREAIGRVLNGAEPAWRAFVRAGAASADLDERRAYVGLAATKPKRLREALGIEHPKGRWPAGRVRERAAILRRRGVADDEIRLAIELVGLRAVGEALAGSAGFGWHCRCEAMRATTRERAEAFIVLAASEVARVRELMFALGREAAGSERGDELTPVGETAVAA
jgi:hypothetical protein